MSFCALRQHRIAPRTIYTLLYYNIKAKIIIMYILLSGGWARAHPRIEYTRNIHYSMRPSHINLCAIVCRSSSLSIRLNDGGAHRQTTHKHTHAPCSFSIFFDLDIEKLNATTKYWRSVCVSDCEKGLFLNVTEN